MVEPRFILAEADRWRVEDGMPIGRASEGESRYASEAPKTDNIV